MFCKNCGSEIREGALFCANCGSAVEDICRQTIESTKKKNKIIGVVTFGVVVVILLIGIGIAARMFFGGGHYEEVAMKYAESYFTADYNGIKDCLPYDVDEMFYDMFHAICRDEDMSLEEGYEEFEEEFEISINGADDLLEKYCDGYARMINEENAEYSIKVEWSDSRKLEDYEIEAAIEENNYYYSEWGVDLNDYVDKDKIKKGYEVRLEVTFDDEYVDVEEFTYTVVKYKGKWKVLTIFNPDMY